MGRYEKLSENEKWKFKDLFRYFDKDRDKKVNEEDFKILLRCMGVIKTDYEIRLLIEKLKDDKELVTFDQFCEYVLESKEEKVEENEFIEAFKLFDKTNSGVLSVDDVRYILGGIGEEMDSLQIDDIMEIAPVDKHGNIPYADFVSILVGK